MKISTWYPSAAYSGLYLFGPESLGGRGSLLVKAEQEAATTGKPFDVAAAEVNCDEILHCADDADSPRHYRSSPRPRVRSFASPAFPRCTIMSTSPRL